MRSRIYAKESLQMITSLLRKTTLVVFGAVLLFLLLEGSLRLSGFILSSTQESDNLQSMGQKGAYRILCLGESITAGQYPHFLEQVLNQRNIGVRFSVINKGVPGTNTSAILSRVESYLAEYHPDMVVAMMGNRDKGVRYFQDMSETDTWIFRHCRVYRFCRMLMDVLKKIKRENIYKGNPGLRGFRLSGSKISEIEKSFKKAIELNPKNDNACVELGRLYRNQGDFFSAENLFEKAIKINPDNNTARVELGWLYRSQKKFSRAEDLYRKAIEHNPKNDKTYLQLAWFFREQGKLPQAEDLFKRAIEINPKNGRAFRAMSSLCEEMGKPELAKEYAEKANGLRSGNYAAVTVRNYQKLKEILDKKGIKLVCSQYPVRWVEPLKKIFGEDKGVIFVDNERVFREALRKSSYKEYFKDMLGADFGHCTQKGDELLAQNIADVILKEVFHK
jgi:tetratricopeptide (TPR) repeat protein